MLMLPVSASADESGIEPRVSAGSGHTQALCADGSVWGWGMMYYGGNLADGSTAGHKGYKKVPVQAKGSGGKGFLTNITDISCSTVTTLALTSEGTVYGWGVGDQGQLGQGQKRNSAVPVQVKSPDGTGFLADIKAVAAGHAHGCALKKDGTIWTWGLNDRGQLGNGTYESSPLPVQVKDSGGTGVFGDIISIAAGVGHCAAVDSSGTVWTWGENVVGQLGDGTTEDRNLPVKIESIKDAVFAGAGYYHTLIICKDGSVFGFGYNVFGQLGNGDAYDSHVPVQMKDAEGTGFFTDAVKAGGGSLHTLIIKKDGTLWACGGNAFSQLGLGKTCEREALPRQVKAYKGEGFITGVVDADGGSVHSTAVTDEGKVYSWGDNYRAQSAGDPSVPLGGHLYKGEFVDYARFRKERLHKKGGISVKGPPWPWPAQLPGKEGMKILHKLKEIDTGSADAVPEVVSCLDNEDAVVRVAAVRILGKFDPKITGVVQGLTKALDDKDPYVKSESIGILKECGAAVEGVIPALKKALKDENSSIKGKAIRVLGEIVSSDKDVVDLLWSIVKNKEEGMGTAFDALTMIGENAVPLLAQGLSDFKDTEMRRRCVLALAEMREKAAAAVPALAKAIVEDKDPKVRKHAGWALSRVGPAAREAVDALKKALKDEDKGVRANAAQALKNIGAN